MTDYTPGVATPYHQCPYCGMGHTGKCPLVKAEEYYPNGTLKRVEFHGPAPINSPTFGPIGEFLAVSDERLRRAVKQREALKKALIHLMKVGKLATEEDYELGRWALDLAEDRE